MTPFRIGTVPYLNAVPLTHSLADDPRIDLQTAPPAELSAMLADGEIDVGMVPTADYCRAAGRWTIVAPYGIVADDQVWTVRFFTDTPIEHSTEINLDAESHSSATLIQVILAEFYHRDNVTFTTRPFTSDRTGDRSAWLLIGDKALKGIDRQYTYDLAQLWKHHTALPFVFALWAAPAETPLDPLRDILTRTAEGNLNRLDQLADRYAVGHRFTPDVAREYFNHVIRYRIGEPERQSIDLFDRLIDKYDLKGPVHDSTDTRRR